MYPNPIALATLLAEAGVASSRSDARRLIAQNAVTINDEKVEDPQAEVRLDGGEIIKVGKRKFLKVEM